MKPHSTVVTCNTFSINVTNCFMHTISYFIEPLWMFFIAWPAITQIWSRFWDFVLIDWLRVPWTDEVKIGLDFDTLVVHNLVKWNRSSDVSFLIFDFNVVKELMLPLFRLEKTKWMPVNWTWIFTESEVLHLIPSFLWSILGLSPTHFVCHSFTHNSQLAFTIVTHTAFLVESLFMIDNSIIFTIQGDMWDCAIINCLSIDKAKPHLRYTTQWKYFLERQCTYRMHILVFLQFNLLSFDTVKSLQ